MTRDYCGIANQYIDHVLSGKIIACEYVKLACERQRNDLGRDFDYRFDADKASRVCKFIELLPHIKGKWAREKQLLTLEPWQIFILTTVFGWVDPRGFRRFKTVYTEVPKKNAKSTLSSGAALYLLSADDEAGAEVYSAATTRDQAQIVFQSAKSMVERTPGLRRRFGVGTSAHRIFVERNASSFKALSRDKGGSLDGLNVHGGIIDELHAHKTRDVFDVIETATGARDQPLLWLITTAGFNRAGICYEQRSYGIKILKKAVPDDEYFSVIYTIDESDDWTSPESWKKANPNWDVSVSPDDIARKARKAMEMAAAQNNFLTKHLNVWVNADTAWMDMRAWERCGDSSLCIDDFTGKPCWIACDLASKRDIASVAILFYENDQFYLFSRNYLNAEAIEVSPNSQYSGWARENWLIETDGNVTDFESIEQDIRDLSHRFVVKEVIFDPFQASYIGQRLSKDGFNVIEYGATVGNFSEPMKELEAMTLSAKLTHENSPAVTWMMSNVVAHLDKKDNVYPNKEFFENKIDAVVAFIMVIGRFLSHEEVVSPYESRGLRTL